MFDDALPIVDNARLSLLDYLVIVLLLGLGEILVAPDAVLWRRHGIRFALMGLRYRALGSELASARVCTKVIFHFGQYDFKVFMHALVLAAVFLRQQDYKVVEAHHLLSLPVGKVAEDYRRLTTQVFGVLHPCLVQCFTFVVDIEAGLLLFFRVKPLIFVE